MMLRSIFALAAETTHAVASPVYPVPAMVKAAQFCEYPEEFVVKNFQIWNPDAGNNRSTTITFDYSDDTTHLETKCQFNETSVNVAPKGLTPRYACDSIPDLVQFIWQNDTLTMVERACWLEDGMKPMEAAGSVTPHLSCWMSTRNSTIGAGSLCESKPKVLSAVFVSLQPRPE